MMLGRFVKDDVVEVKPGVRLPFRYSNRRGIVRFAYDHDPPGYEVEFYWCGESLGRHYFAEDELEPWSPAA